MARRVKNLKCTALQEARRIHELQQQRQDGVIRDRAKMMEASDLEIILGPMPEVAKPKRKEACKKDLEKYLRTYSPEVFYRPFSPEHQRFIHRLQEAMEQSLWTVQIFPRGYGKTTLTEGAARWAISYGHKRFIPIIGSGIRHANEIIASIKSEFESNDLLYEDFPEIIHAIRALEGRWQRCKSQRYHGHNTLIQWKGNKVVFPNIDGSPASGSVLSTHSWTSHIRGLKHTMPDGSIARPDLVLIDDPQTDEMAASVESCTKFLDTLQGAILGLGGHDKRISVVMPSTIIRNYDAIDRLTDQKEYPAWIVENIPMLKEHPENLDLWLGEYARLRADFDRSVASSQRKAATNATKFYKANRKEMDAGAVATWKECYGDGEISSIQHAMNIWIDRGEDFFMAECQGRPTDRLGSGALVTDIDLVARKISGMNKRITSADTQVITGFIDISHTKLQWMICGWRMDFGGTILDYGVWPEGSQELSTLEGSSLSAAVFKGLAHLIGLMSDNPIPTLDGDARMLRTILVDCGDPATRDAVFQTLRAGRFRCRVLPSRGRAHHQFYIPDPKKKMVLQNGFVDMWKGLGPVVVHDACLWRERFQRAIMTAQGGPGSIDVFGVGQMRHRELATQLCSERLVEKLMGTTGEMYKWTRVPGTRTHFLDCGVGNMIAATVEGIRYGQEIEIQQEGRHARGSKVEGATRKVRSSTPIDN